MPLHRRYGLKTSSGTGTTRLQGPDGGCTPPSGPCRRVVPVPLLFFVRRPARSGVDAGTREQRDYCVTPKTPARCRYRKEIPSFPWYEGLPPPNLRRRAAKPWLLDLFLSNRRRCEHRHDDTSCEEAVRRPHPHHTALSLQLRPFGLLANQRPFLGGSPSSLPPSAGRRLAG